MSVLPRSVRPPRRQRLTLSVLLALAAPLAAHAGVTCDTAPATTTGTVSGDTALACGNNSTATGSGATAFGNTSQAGFIDNTDPNNPIWHGQHALAVGDTAKALGDHDIAIGANAFGEGHDTPSGSSNDDNLALGAGANARGGASIAIGNHAGTLAPSTGSPDSGQYGIALGTGAYDNAANTVALGFAANAAGRWTVAIGQYNTNAYGESSVAIGNSAGTAKGADDSVDILSYPVSGINAISIGTGNDTHDFGINVMGSVNGFGGISIGDQSGTGNGQGALFIGFKASTWGAYTADDAIGIGDSANASGSDATALGTGTYADGNADLAIGNGANTNYQNADGTPRYSVALGASASDSDSSQAGDLAVGYKAGIFGGGGSVIGTSASVAGQSVTIGGWYDGGSGSGANASTQANIGGTNSVGIGANAESASDHDVLLGADTLGGQTNGTPSGNAVALGYGSAYDRADSVSVGNAAGNTQVTRQITRVAAATADTDAINVGQMNAAIQAAGNGGGIDTNKAKAYVDAGDTAALKAADQYTDQANLTADASVLVNIKTHANAGDAAALKSAKAHANVGDAATLKSAHAHADAGDKAAHAYVDSQIARALETAGEYTKVNDRTTLSRAEAYTQSRLANLGLADFKGFERDVDQRFREQGKRLDRTGALGAAMAGMTASAAGVKARSTRLGIAVGSYHGQSALALGVQHAFGTRLVLTLGAGVAGSGDTSLNLGFGIHL